MILKYLGGRDWAMVALSVVLIAAMVYLELEIPGYMSTITTEIVRPEGANMDVVYSDGLMMLACAFGSLLLSVAVGCISAWIATSLSKTPRTGVRKSAVLLAGGDEQFLDI